MCHCNGRLLYEDDDCFFLPFSCSCPRGARRAGRWWSSSWRRTRASAQTPKPRPWTLPGRTFKDITDISKKVKLGCVIPRGGMFTQPYLHLFGLSEHWFYIYLGLRFLVPADVVAVHVHHVGAAVDDPFGKLKKYTIKSYILQWLCRRENTMVCLVGTRHFSSVPITASAILLEEH